MVRRRTTTMLDNDAARARLLNPDRPADPDVRSLQYADNPARSPRRLVAAAAVALIVAAGAEFVDTARNAAVTTSPDRTDRVTASTEPATTTSEHPTTTSEPVTTASETSDGTTFARATNVKVIGCCGQEEAVPCSGCPPALFGRTLNIDAAEEDGTVTGEFRIDDVVVSVQCARTNGFIRRDLILGGEVIANPDGLATLDGVDVAVGDLVALAIREGDGAGQRVTLYEKSSWHGEQATSASCHELIWSFPPNLDGGYFEPVKPTP